MNKKTKALTTEQYKEIIAMMKEGFCGCRPNERIATALVLEGNLGLRSGCGYRPVRQGHYDDTRRQRPFHHYDSD